MKITIKPPQAGHYVMLEDVSGPLLDAFIGTLRMPAPLPPGAVLWKNGTCVVGFSRLCPHMGCRLVRNVSKSGTSRPLRPDVPAGDPEQHLLRCQCHFSCFDLFAEGLAVMGPATDWLAMLDLRATGDGQTVTLDTDAPWRTGQSVPFGVPFGATLPGGE
jgi:Rieske Fe-S protein